MASKGAVRVAELIFGKDSETSADSVAELIDEALLPAVRVARAKGRCCAIYELSEHRGFTAEWVKEEIQFQLGPEDLFEAGLECIESMRPPEVMQILIDEQCEDRLDRRTGFE